MNTSFWYSSFKLNDNRDADKGKGYVEVVDEVEVVVAGLVEVYSFHS